jgi:predicted ribosomally synthesized peptide with SipW-like signal peptide
MKRKTLITGSLLIAVLLSAAVGGAYAVFTDTEAMHVQFEAGTIDIALNGEDDAYQEFFLDPREDLASDDWKPGDYIEWTFDIDNTGSNAAWIQMYVYPTGPWSEDPKILDLWDIAEYEWDWNAPGEWNQWVLQPGESMTMTLAVDFPQEAGNEWQGAQADLLILVVAKQWRNKLEEGYSCIALEDKSAPTWLPDLSNDLEGIICYKYEGGEMHVDLNAYGLEPGVYYQLDLTGGDVNNPIDGSCTTQDANLAGMAPGDLYTSGYWNWGTFLEASCNATNGGEGVFNYAGVYGDVQADASGAISYGGTFTLPAGTYAGVGAHVKEIQGEIPGNNWPVILSEMDYLSFGP